MSSSDPNGSSAAESAETTVSLDDINAENRERRALEADARAVLGNSDAEHCTWDKGYVKRQALYACVTCRPNVKDESTRAGVCLACSYSCHDGHELVELYTKRNFRCDCGNHKFRSGEGSSDQNAGGKCKLMPDKDDSNPDNIYNHNYDGVYCTCARPYPDPNDSVQDEMIQCVVCEDWYHSRHLRISAECNGGKVPEEYHEMICQLCSTKQPFLSSYATRDDVSKATTAISSTDASSSGASVSIADAAATECGDSSRKRRLSEASRPANDEECRLKRSKKSKSDDDQSENASSSSSTALFFTEGWRLTLCACAHCRRMYEEEKIAFITEEEDSISAYEAAGEAEGGLGEEEEEEAALGSLLGGMDRFQQGEMVAGYNDMKTSLNEYLRKFAEEGKVVTADDIRNFFQEMEAKKKSKGNPQYFCG